MLVIGEKEVDAETLSVRKHGSGDIGSMDFEAFKTYFDNLLNN